MNNRILLSLILSFITVNAISMTYVYLYEEPVENLRTTQSQKNNKLNQQKKNSVGRELELGFVEDSLKNVKNEPSALFNDPAIKQAWGLKKADAGRAWSITKGDKKVIVAVIDTGIDIQHEDLKSNLWQNPGEIGLDQKGQDKANNGIDDDQNGYIDDVHGWNFVSKNNKLDDNHGHGTHIAGIIGSEAGNKKGISGISPEVSLMILKYFDPKVVNSDNLKNTIQSIEYAVKMGAHIINYSGGGTEFSQEEKNAIISAEKKGILFVAAAGNEKSNSDKFHYYPADYKLKNIISVTAIDPSTEVLPSSNYGTDTVDIAAPGQSILSSLPQNTYGLMTGTSQATAFVTGGAVLVMAHKDLYYSAEEVKKFIIATGDISASLVSKTRTSRQLNLFKCLTILESQTSISGQKPNLNFDRKIFNAQTNNSNTLGRDPNSPESGRDSDRNSDLKKISGFSQELVRALNRNEKKEYDKTRENRLGTVPETDTEN